MCFVSNSQSVSFTEAQRKCNRRINGILARFRDVQDMKNISGLTQNLQYWVGADYNNRTNVFKWENGDEVGETYNIVAWSQPFFSLFFIIESSIQRVTKINSESSELCGAIHGNGSDMILDDCAEEKPFVCMAPLGMINLKWYLFRLCCVTLPFYSDSIS